MNGYYKLKWDIFIFCFHFLTQFDSFIYELKILLSKLFSVATAPYLFIHLKTVLVLACGKHRLKLKNTCTEAIRNIDKDSFEQNLVVKEKNNILNI